MLGFFILNQYIDGLKVLYIYAYDFIYVHDEHFHSISSLLFIYLKVYMTLYGA